MSRTKKLQVTNPGLIGSRVIKNEFDLKKELVSTAEKLSNIIKKHASQERVNIQCPHCKESFWNGDFDVSGTYLETPKQAQTDEGLSEAAIFGRGQNDINSVENVLACMAEGDGERPEIYQLMAKNALNKLRATRVGLSPSEEQDLRTINELRNKIKIMEARASQFESTLKETMRVRDEALAKLKVDREARAAQADSVTVSREEWAEIQWRMEDGQYKKAYELMQAAERKQK